MIDPVAEQSQYGGLERWLHDPSVTELMVNAGGEIWVERDGHIVLVGRMRTSTLLAAIERLLTPVGRRLDRAHPMVDARMADGARLCAVIEPIAVDGPCLAIRRFPVRDIPLARFAEPVVVDVLRELVRRRCNLVVSGATSSGKTTLLNALAREIEPDCRVVTLEDVAELRLAHPHVVRFETREATPEGVGEVTLAHLLRTALRMRPDRLVVGEVRGAEAVHLLQALNTGHDGSLCTVHANSAVDALHRIASLVLQEVAAWPLSAVHQHVTRAVDAVVHTARATDGHRRVVEVVEVATVDERGLLHGRPLVLGDRVVGSPERGRR
jgi:pilus assembly protein CpaF